MKRKASGSHVYNYPCMDKRLLQAEELLLSKNIDIAKLREEFANHIRIHDRTMAEAADIRKQVESQLRDVLAIIHRDGGHYTADHGLGKSIEDACLRVTGAYGEIAAKDREIAELRKDRERLDWLGNEVDREMNSRSPYVLSLFRRNVPVTREAIDAVMKETNAGKD